MSLSLIFESGDFNGHAKYRQHFSESIHSKVSDKFGCKSRCRNEEHMTSRMWLRIRKKSGIWSVYCRKCDYMTSNGIKCYCCGAPYSFRFEKKTYIEE